MARCRLGILRPSDKCLGASWRAHLAPALKALNKMERQVEADFLPTKPDPSNYAKEVEVQALDEQGHPLTDPEDNMIIVKQWVVHSP